ncbi:MAG: hypothetical protein V2I27_14025 [Erythrobacter sp.]|jgi:hypothetical protein|nr:hypothetical protein [Erythrobacter sp.]
MPISLPYVDRIWRVKDALELEEALTPSETFARLDPLFQTQGTTYSHEGDTLTYSKKNPAAQDKLSTFTAGTLRHVHEGGSAYLRYDVTSTALLLCFLAPLFFLAFAGFILVVNELEAPYVAAEKAAEEKEKEKKKEKEREIKLHWIDQMLGAPEPKQKDEEEDKKREERGREKKEKDDARHSPDRALYLAALFFVIYCVGRVLEPYLLKRTFRRLVASRSHARDADFKLEA